MDTQLIWLNQENGAANIEEIYLTQVMRDFPRRHLTALVVGCAWGGAVEAYAKVLGERGDVYGYDTFEGHPKHLCEDEKEHEACCMDPQYGKYGMDGLSIEYQTDALNSLGLTNAHLIKGEVSSRSWSDIKTVQFALLDMDIEGPTRLAYNALKRKIVSGGYLLLHDVIPEKHLPRLHSMYRSEIVPEGLYEVVSEHPESYLAVLRRL